MKLTPIQASAIDYIGRHRKKAAKIGAGTRCSTRTLNQLIQWKLVMWNGSEPMLTYLGEREFTKLHPRSKYRIS